MRLRLPAFCFVILSLLLLWYVKPFSCASTIYTWYGMLPAQIAASAAVSLIGFLGTPLLSTGTLPILQACHSLDCLLSYSARYLCNCDNHPLRHPMRQVLKACAVVDC